MLGTHFYHEIIRKTIVGFGTLFNNIELRRSDKQGNIVQTVKVPLNYGPREKFLARIDAEPTLDGRSEVQIQLPRISFEMKGITYDPSRKLSPVQICVTPKSGDTKAVYKQYSPVPYNLDFELNIISKNNDDSVQILEQILPYFQPVFNISVKLVDLTKEVKDIPIILNSVNMQDDYEGDFLKRRALIHTLTFTAKTYLYGPVATSDVIRTVNVDIGTAINAGSRYVRYSATPKALEDYNSDGSGIAFDAFNISSNTITLINHGFVTGDFVTYRSDPNGQPTGGLLDSKEYYIIKIDNNNFRVAGTKYNAQRGYGIDLTSQGTGGNHKFSIINTLDDAFVESDDNFGFNDTWTEY
jgi:hypothetical protein|tara:strand:+ start:996 stop:2060 length:1065 start_codon:yes stop_codon:yes gene_type:complete